MWASTYIKLVYQLFVGFIRHFFSSCGAAAHGISIREVSRSHSMTHHSR